MNKKRLLKLADLLEKDAKNKKGIKFDMRHWGDVDNHSEPLSCGTTACAMGLAAISGAFKSAGLDYEVSYSLGFRFIYKTTRSITRSFGGIAAAKELFGIPEIDAVHLFVPKSGPQVGARAERHVAKRIRKYVATGNLT